jgi:hypothetical protein
MEMVQLNSEIYEVAQRLQNAAKEIYKLANKRAVTERTYRLNLSQEIVKLRAEGLPATLIADTARGNVADMKFQRDLAEGQYRSSIEALEALKAQLSALQTISKYQDAV